MKKPLIWESVLSITLLTVMLCLVVIIMVVYACDD